MFEPQLGKSIEIYVDDMVVKSKVVSEHLRDFDSTFGVGSGKFLGYVVTHRGIEVNPTKSRL